MLVFEPLCLSTQSVIFLRLNSSSSALGAVCQDIDYFILSFGKQVRQDCDFLKPYFLVEPLSGLVVVARGDQHFSKNMVALDKELFHVFNNHSE